VIIIKKERGNFIVSSLSVKGLQISPSATLEITSMAKKMRESGINVISFGAGEPDFNTPNYIVEAAIKAMREGNTRYTSVSGIPELKEAIIHKFKKDNGIEYKQDEVMVANGAKHILYNAIQAICNPGDEVIVLSPYWLSYPEMIKLADAIPVTVDTNEEENFSIDLDRLEKSITKKTKAIIINSPNNPTGVVYPKEVLEKIADLALKYNIFIISDEIYEKLIYDDNIKHVSIASFGKEIKELTITVNGVSKTYAMTGWRIGYCGANKNIISIMSNIQSHSTSNPNTIAQFATLAALTQESHEINEMIEKFRERRNYMVKTLNTIKGITCNNPQGAFYVMVNINNFINKEIDEIKINGAKEFAKVLLEKAKVAVVPCESFGTEKFIRLSYATSLENIVEGLNRIKFFIESSLEV